MEELESKDTCLNEEAEQNVIVSVGAADKQTGQKILKEREHVEIRNTVKIKIKNRVCGVFEQEWNLSLSELRETETW